MVYLGQRKRYFFIFCLLLGGVFFRGAAQSDGLELCEAATEAKLYAGLNGWLYYNGDLVPAPPLRSPQYLTRLKDAFQANGSELVMLIVPNRGMVNPEHFDTQQPEFAAYDTEAARQGYLDFVSALNAAGVTAPDLLSPVLASPEREAYGQRRDPHWSPEGAQIVAGAVAETVKGLAVYGDLEKQAFTTTKDELLEKAGGLANRVSKLCPDISFAPNSVQSYTTVADGSASLLGEQTIDVVLFGTSFSQPGAVTNLDGFLRTELGTEIYNAADGGGAAFVQ